MSIYREGRYEDLKYPPNGTFSTIAICYLSQNFHPLFKRFANIDVGLLFTLATNVYLIWEYVHNNASIDTIILLFYVQSVLIGVFNALDMFTVNTTNANEKSEAAELPRSSKGCAGLFFMVHYGGFHFVYLFFLPQIINFQNINWPLFQLALALLVIGCIINFIQDKLRNRIQSANLLAMFFMPYARIIPMHLTILAPQFLHISAPLLFLSLKTIADVITYLIYRHVVFGSALQEEGFRIKNDPL